MAKTASVPTQKYIDLISKSDTEKSKELIGLEAEQAANVLEQGTLTVKGQLINAQGNVKKAEIALSNAQAALKATHGAKPFNVQNIINNRVAVLNAEKEVEARIEAHDELAGHFDYLVVLKTELF